MRDHSLGYTLDEALTSVGFGTFQGLALVFAGIGWFSEAVEVSLLSFIGPALTTEWSLSPTAESLLSTTVFGGMLFGACFWGFISDAYGRRTAIQLVSLGMFGSGLLSAFSPDYKTLAALRFFMGFGAAGGHVFLSWFLEFLPSSNRGTWMLVMTCSWIFGEMLEASLAWVIMPRLGWRWLLGFSSIPSLTLFLISNFTPESPRYLFTAGKTNDAMRILEKVARINRKELPNGYLIADQNVQVDEEKVPSEQTTLLTSSTSKIRSLEKSLKSICELFAPDLYVTTLLLWGLNFAYTFAYYGIQLMVSALSSRQNDCQSTPSIFNTMDTGIYINGFITCSAELPGLLLAVILVDRIGRKPCLEVLTVLSLIFMVPLLWPQGGLVTTSLLICSRMFLSAAFETLCVYSTEVYPTSVRARGFGISSAVGRIGGMLCPLVAVGLVRGCHQTLSVILFGVVTFLSGIFVMFFPLEMRKRGLADVVASEQ
ncbi:organic cation/carnitine transporter 7-like [Andrographis paniculata]|uniref:organic cation/carnitine transporter 7-like n=1 Tax=Andrographis paniculata TaxID=175694 RepID=UPI0021E9676E|nr:organic cation/carnitine transporter 7-like [Andrographis paniculata]XP_051150521.1 organic cation/carnitine transporter 7-like [Andrographis paniculata]